MKIKTTYLLTCILITLSSQVIGAKEKWVKLANEDNIQIFSKTASNGVLPFKAEGVIKTNIETLLNILKNHKTKNKWAPKLDKVTLHESQKNNQFIFSEYYKTPWPATDREFLLAGSILRPNQNTVVLKAHSIDQNKTYTHLKSPNHIQADVQYINVILNKVSLHETRIQFEFHGDMKGWMPLWLMNLIQKKWPLRFIQGLRKYSAKQGNHALSLNQSY